MILLTHRGCLNTTLLFIQMVNESMLGFIFVLDEIGTIELATESSYNIIGYTSSEIQGDIVYNFIQSGDFTKLMIFLKNNLRKKVDNEPIYEGKYYHQMIRI